MSTRESRKDIMVSDRATLFNLLIGLNGYTICSGIINEQTEWQRYHSGTAGGGGCHGDRLDHQ